ncbi:MAG: hypothetical protein DRJ05_07460 [Bacteroidetes bacterium]|nr:MAG: hypothetical protein DRJ05_07460 [Bacteroidota bacterium]
MNKVPIIFSKHIQQRIKDRNLDKQWILNAIESPDKTVLRTVEEVYYFKKIADFAGRCLKVVFNPTKNLVVTAYFDRKMTKNNCT